VSITILELKHDAALMSIVPASPASKLDALPPVLGLGAD
jgi:hypothetical protein